GPIGAYRGFDDGTDARIAQVNAALASATIFQSEFSLAKHRELGFELREPVVIPNAVDPAIFHPPTNLDPDRFELTFAGRPPAAFEQFRVVGPLESSALAELLRTQDAYIAPSRDD